MQIKNEFISEVFGKFDENIKKLENAFSVSIVNRDENIIISGDENNVKLACKVLSAIVSRVIFREKISKVEWISVFGALVSTILFAF